MPSPSTATNIGSGFGAASDLFGAVSSFLGGQSNSAALQAEAGGYGQEAAGFDKAAQLEDFNAKYAKVSGDIQDIQTKRKIYQSESGTMSDLAGANLADSGSAIGILRSSAEQGALTLGMTDTQTAINVNSYVAQENAYEGEANQARAEQASAEAAASGAETGGILGAIGGVLKAGAMIAPMFA